MVIKQRSGQVVSMFFGAKRIISDMQIRCYSKQGEKFKRFYLPVIRHRNSMAYECWIFPLAPVVFTYHLLKDVCWVIWYDLINVLQDVIEWRKSKNDSSI